MPVRAAWWWYRSSECKGAGSGVGVVWAGPRAQRPCLGGAGRSQSVAHLPGVQRAWVDRNIRGCRRNRRDGGVVIRAEHAKRVSMAVSRGYPPPPSGWGRGATRLGREGAPAAGRSTQAAGGATARLRREDAGGAGRGLARCTCKAQGAERSLPPSLPSPALVGCSSPLLRLACATVRLRAGMSSMNSHNHHASGVLGTSADRVWCERRLQPVAVAIAGVISTGVFRAEVKKQTRADSDSDRRHSLSLSNVRAPGVHHNQAMHQALITT